MNPHPVRPRQYFERRTRWERLKRWFEMPRLTRRDRNQRLAIAGILLLFGIYLVARPVVGRFLKSRPSHGSNAAYATKK